MPTARSHTGLATEGLCRSYLAACLKSEGLDGGWTLYEVFPKRGLAYAPSNNQTVALGVYESSPTFLPAGPPG